MSTWTSDELDALAAATDLRISTRRPDGTLRSAVPIWVVRAGDSIYVRSYRGPDGGWFRHATARGAAHIQVGTVNTEVTVTPASATARAEIDQAYRAKYSSFGHAYVDPMTASLAAATTLQLTPRNAERALIT
jgi:hypothetical protein